MTSRMSTILIERLQKLENYSFTYDENKKSIVSSNMTLPLIHHVSYTILLLITAGAQNHPSRRLELHHPDLQQGSRKQVHCCYHSYCYGPYFHSLSCTYS